jgi:hypothetical protein
MIICLLITCREGILSHCRCVNWVVFITLQCHVNAGNEILHNESMLAKSVSFPRKETQDLAEKHLGCRREPWLIDICSCEGTSYSSVPPVVSHGQISINRSPHLNPICFSARSCFYLRGKLTDFAHMLSVVEHYVTELCEILMVDWIDQVNFLLLEFSVFLLWFSCLFFTCAQLPGSNLENLYNPRVDPTYKVRNSDILQIFSIEN